VQETKNIARTDFDDMLRTPFTIWAIGCVSKKNAASKKVHTHER
jgi:hypothetical protein